MDRPDSASGRDAVSGGADVIDELPAGPLVIIDDDPADRLMLRELLAAGTFAGTEVREAVNRRQGLRQVTADTVCVIVDYMLGDDSGLDVIAELRARFRAMPIILVTGQGDEEVTVEALRRGADDYLSKAKLGPEPLVRAIRGAVTRQQHAEAARLSNERLELFAELTDSAADLLFIVDAQTDQIILANLAARRTLGRVNDDLMIRPSPVANLFRSGESTWNAIRGQLNHVWNVRFETEIWAGGYSGRAVEVSARLVTRKLTSYIVCIARDIAEQRRLQSELLRLATLDPVTELPRMEAFRAHWGQCVAAAAPELKVGVVCVVQMLRLQGAGFSVTSGSRADWRGRVGRQISQAAERSGGVAGVDTETVFLLAFPCATHDEAEAFLLNLNDELQALAQQQPKAPLSSSTILRTDCAVGAVLGPIADMGAESRFRAARELSDDARFRSDGLLIRDVDAKE